MYDARYMPENRSNTNREKVSEFLFFPIFIDLSKTSLPETQHQAQSYIFKIKIVPAKIFVYILFLLFDRVQQCYQTLTLPTKRRFPNSIPPREGSVR